MSHRPGLGKASPAWGRSPGSSGSTRPAQQTSQPTAGHIGRGEAAGHNVRLCDVPRAAPDMSPCDGTRCREGFAKPGREGPCAQPCIPTRRTNLRSRRAGGAGARRARDAGDAVRGSAAPPPHAPAESAELAAIAAAQCDPVKRSSALAIVVFGIAAGLRPGELMALPGSDVARRGRRVVVHVSGSAVRIVPLTCTYAGRAANWPATSAAGLCSGPAQPTAAIRIRDELRREPDGRSGRAPANRQPVPVQLPLRSSGRAASCPASLCVSV